MTINGTSFTAADTLIVTVATDEQESGFNLTDDQHACWVGFSTPNPNVEFENLDSVCANLTTEISPGVLQVEVPLNKNVGGVYTVYAVELCDKDGNSDTYSFPDVSFTLTSDYQIPPQPPNPADTALKTFKLSSNTAVVGSTITYTIKASDPTVVKMTMDLKPMSLPWYYENTRYDLPLTAVRTQPGVFTGSIKITSDMPPADYYPENVILTLQSGGTIEVGWPSNYSTYLGDVILKVSNPALVPKDITPVLTSFSISTHQAVQGQTISMTATLNNGMPKFDRVRLSLFNTDSGQAVWDRNGVPMDLQYQGGETYSGTCQIPLNIRHGHYVVLTPSVSIGYDWTRLELGPTLQGNITYYDGTPATYIKGTDITISPVVSITGTDNGTVLVGDSFDPMQGVTATNASTGQDLTDKILLTGSVDTAAPGVYLLKYVATDDIAIKGGTTPFTYTVYRWIGVSEIQPDASAGSQTPLAITDNSLTIGASSSDASVQLNGSPVAFKNGVTAPGVYTVTGSGTDSEMTSSGAAVKSASQPGFDSQGVFTAHLGGSKVTAVIDRTAPAVQIAWQKTASGIRVELKAIDITGVTHIKYLAGTCSLAACKNDGTEYTNSFNLPGYGTVTVYTRDKLGNEAAKVYAIKASSSDSSYLSDISLSAGTLSPSFTKTVYHYKVHLGENTGSVTITPAAQWSGARILIDGKAVSSANVSVANGKSRTVAIKVIYGTHTRVYKLTITRAKSTNCNLAALSASAGSFNVQFDPAVTSYKLTLDEHTKTVRLQDTTASPLARASIKNKTVSLNPGRSTVVKIRVRAQSGVTKTYTITITRK